MTTNRNPITIEDYLKGDDMCIAVVKKKYLKPATQLVSDCFDSVIRNICNVTTEKDELEKEIFINEVYDDWINGYWKGAGSIISSGNDVTRNVSIANCSTITIPADTLDAILDTKKFATKMAAHRQGFGVHFDALRPKGSPINNSAEVSLGAVHWMKSFDRIGFDAGQLGRMPAILISLSVKHLDVEEFINCKNDLDSINNANISVHITDDFMMCVKEDGIWHQEFIFKNGSKIEKDVNARGLFKQICENAWRTGEPGVQFIDKMRSWSIQEALGYKIVGSNACVTGDTVILTKTGYVQIKDRVGLPTIIWNGYDWSEVTPIITGYNKEIYDIEFSDGSILPCTDYHGFNLKGNKNKVECKDLQIGDKLTKWNFPIIEGEITEDTKKMYTQGFYSGDGRSVRTQIFLYEDKRNLIEFLDHNTVSDISTERQNRDYVHVNLLKHDKAFVPDCTYSVKSRLDWLAGLIDSDGCYCDGGIQISSIDRNFLQNVKYMLHGLGGTANLTPMKKACKKLMPDGKGGQKEYNCKDSYRIHIPLWFVNDLRNFGLVTHRVDISRNVKNKIVKYIKIISKVKRATLEDKVYCFTEEKNHTGIFMGICTAQCGEKPMPDQSICCLAPLNVAKVPNPFTHPKEFHAFMSTVVPRMVRFMDNVIQFELDHPFKSPTEKQRETVEALREIGLGIFNLHAWFYNNNVAYGSDESINLTEEFFKWYQYYAFKASCQLALDRIPCPAWTKMHNEKQLESSLTPFLVNLFQEFPDIEEMYYGYGIRNGALLSVAPTGSISMFFPDFLSTGIEPLMGYAYWRKTRALSVDQSYNYFFVLPKMVKDMLLEKMSELECGSGDSLYNDIKFIENTSISQEDTNGEIGKKVMALIKEHLDVSLLTPAHEINPFQKIKLMAACQKWNDAAISVTYNVREDFPVEDVERLYMAAFDSQLKSLAIYRNNSREGIYIFEDPINYNKRFEDNKSSFNGCLDRPDHIVFSCAPKRPPILDCEIHHCQIKGDKWIILIGLLDGYPYEIFAGQKNEDFNLSKNIKEGKIIKGKKGTYSLSIPFNKSEIIYHNIADLFMNTEYKALTRLISLAMRKGTHYNYIVDQLKKSSDYVGDFMAVVSRVLNKYVKDANILDDKKNSCPACGEGIVNEAGCIHCSVCDWSKCS